MSTIVLSRPSRGVFHTQASNGISDEAKTLWQSMAELQNSFLTSFSIGKPKRDVLESTTEVFEESCHPDWDGYSAAPVSFETYLKAKKFLSALPTNLPTPEVSAHPDGQIGFEWFVAPNRQFVMGISSEDELAYAGIFGINKTSGVELFIDEIPKAVLEGIRRLF
jgi:hypothetical protein